MSKAKSFMDFLGNMWADVEDYVSENFESYKKRVIKLQSSAKGRNADIWANAGADISLTTEDFGSVPVSERDTNWRALLEAMLAASRAQALYDVGFFEQLIKMSDRHGEQLNDHSLNLSQDELRTVIAEFPGSQATENARAARRS